MRTAHFLKVILSLDTRGRESDPGDPTVRQSSPGGSSMISDSPRNWFHEGFQSTVDKRFS